jgi:polyisoprenyl-teichoic acid--peptidoglycan teichoic acid transferase
MPSRFLRLAAALGALGVIVLVLRGRRPGSTALAAPGLTPAPAAALPSPPAALPAPPAASPAASAVARPSRGPRAVTCAGLSLLVPGTGQIHGGRPRRGALILAVVAALLAGTVALAAQGTTFLLGQAVRTDVLLGALGANAALLLARGGVVADAWRLGRRPSARLPRVALLGALLAVVALPHVLVGWYQWSAYDTVRTIFRDVDPADIPPALPFQLSPEINQHAPLPPAWPRWGRLTVLLIGGDAGPGRVGLRTDTMVVATLDTRTRRGALLSLPRNLAEVPLPPRAAGLEPGGRFPDILNALYGWATLHADRFPGRDPGATALKQVAANLTGLRVDYYALVDFRGFVEMVDALGGVTVTVTRPVLDRVSPPEEGDDWIRIDLPAGRQHLDADQAFAYVRARSQSSDYERIRRQRCVLAGLAQQADAGRLLRAFPRIAGAARRNVSTDIPRRVLPDLIRLVSGVDRHRVLSLGFTPPDYTTGFVGPGYPVPDIPAIRAATRTAISGAAARGARNLGGEVCG